MPTTHYLNPTIGVGSDANGGTSWADAWLTFAGGATAAYLAAGDTVRVAKSPDPTDTGQTATWSQGPIPATKTITSSTDANPIVIAATGHGYSTDDAVFITGHTTNTNANGTWRITYVDSSHFSLNGSSGNGAGAGASGTARLINAKTVRLNTAAVTTSVANCDKAWTTHNAGACSAPTVSTTDWKQGIGSASFGILAGAALAEELAYSLTGAANLNLSGYQQVSFWCKSSITLAAGDITICLCSDNLGETVRNIIPVPAVIAASPWQCCTVNYGGALYNGINSISIYNAVDKGAYTFQLDHVIACKASTAVDSITLSSLISKNTAAMGGTEGWWCIQAIDQTVITLDLYNTTLPSYVNAAYGGADATAELWKRECFYLATPGAAAGTSINSALKAGTLGSLITFAGGYNTGGAGNTVDGETFFTGQNGWGCNQMMSYTVFDHLNFVRYYYALQTSASTNTGPAIITNCQTVGHALRGLEVNAPQSLATIMNVQGCSSIGFCIELISCFSIANIYMIDCNDTAINAGGSAGFLADIILNISYIYCNYNGVFFTNTSYPTACGFWLRNCTTKSNSQYAISMAGGGYMGCFNCNFNTDTITVTTLRGSRVFSQKHQGSLDNDVMITDAGIITKVTSPVSGTDPYSWDFSVTGAARTIYYPLSLKLIRVNITTPNKLMTVTVNMQTSDYTKVAGQLVVRGGQVGNVGGTGITNADVVATMAANNNWQAISIQFTPNETGEVEVEAWAYYVTAAAHLYVDTTITVTQAA